MRAQYANLDADLNDGRLHVRAQLRNSGGEAWSQEHGDALSYQVYDADSELLLIDGPRTPIAEDVPPKEDAELGLSVELPPDDGRYRVFVSPLRSDGPWFFETGSPFVAIDVEVQDGEPRILRQAVTTLRKLSRRRLVRSVKRAITYPARTLTRNWSLIRSLVRRDIAGRYAGSYAGAFWTVLHPLLMMIAYWFVFSIVLRTRFGNDDRPGNFVLYFLAGMLPWLAFSEAIGRAPSVILEHAGFVKKLVFPLEILPLNLVLAGLFTEFFGVLIFVVGMLAFGREPTISALWLPIILVPQVLFTTGMCWLFAGLGVIFRDLGQMMGFILTVWMFTTPIFYPASALPGDYLWVFDKNPFFILVEAYRAVLLENSAPDWVPLACLTGLSALLFVAAHAWFYKLKKSFADMV